MSLYFLLYEVIFMQPIQTMRKTKYSIFCDIATKTSLFLTDIKKKQNNQIGINKGRMNGDALEVNPFTEGLHSNSGLDAIKILASSPAMQKRWMVLFVFTVVTVCLVCIWINKELYLSKFIYISVNVSSCSFDLKKFFNSKNLHINYSTFLLVPSHKGCQWYLAH